jgi:hypothetical protein
MYKVNTSQGIITTTTAHKRWTIAAGDEQPWACTITCSQPWVMVRA